MLFVEPFDELVPHVFPLRNPAFWPLACIVNLNLAKSHDSVHLLLGHLLIHVLVHSLNILQVVEGVSLLLLCQRSILEFVPESAQTLVALKLI